MPVSLDAGRVLERMNIRKKRDGMEKSIQEIIELALPIAKPKAVYEVSYIDSKYDEAVDIGGIRFTSRVLRDNLEEANRVFPFVATCGNEIDNIDIPANEFMKCYFLDQIKEMILELA
ncbi:MAG: hypothetical protein R6T87_02955, partial [Marinobacter sp.]